MICVYDGRDAERSGHGLGVIHPNECTITEETGGSYELSATLPLGGEWLLMERGNVIRAPGAPHRLSGQVQDFRIYGVELAEDGRSIRVQARHVFYDAANAFVQEPVEFDAAGVPAVLDAMGAAGEGVPYALDVQTGDATYTGSIDLVNWVNALLDPDAGIVALARLRLERDCMTVHLRPEGGDDSGLTVRWGRNMTGLTRSTMIDQVVTRLQPAGEDAEGNPVYLPEKYIDSPRIGEYWRPLMSVWRVSGAKVGQRTHDADGNTAEMTLEDVYDMLRKAAQERLQSGCDLPKEKTSLAYVDMSRIGAADAAWAAVHVCLYDWLTIVHGAADIQERVQVTGYSWDVLRRVYTQLEVGDAFRDRTDTVIVTAPQLRKESAAARKRSLRVEDLIDIEADEIRQQAREIELIAYDVKDLSSRTSSAEIRLDGLNGRVNLLGTDVEGQGDVIKQVQLDLNAAENKILAKVGKTEFDELSGSVNTLETNVVINVDGLREIIQRNNKTVAELSSTIDGLEHWVTDADGNVSELTNTVRGLESKVTAAGDKVSILTNTADGLTSTILGQGAELTVFKTRIDEISGVVKDTQGNVGSLITKSDSVTAKVSDIEGHVTTLAVTAAGLTNTIIGQGAELTVFKTRIDEISGVVKDTNGAMGQFVVNSNRIAGKLEDANGKLTALQELTENRFSAVIGDIKTVEGEIASVTGSALWQTRNAITGVVGNMTFDEKGNVYIKEGGGLRIFKSGVAYGVYDENNLTAGLLVQKLNDGSTITKIKADVLELDGLVKAGELQVVKADITNLTAGVTTASTLKAHIINADTSLIVGGEIVGKRHISMGSVGTIGKVLSTDTLDLQHSHAVTVNDDGTITLGEVAAEGGNFRIADTKAYKDGVSAATAAVGFASFAASGGVITPRLTNDKTTTYYCSSGSADEDHKIPITIAADQYGGGAKTLMSVDASGVYRSGWNECRAAMSRIYNVYTISQNAPGTLYMLVSGNYTSVGADWVKVSSYNSAYSRPSEIT